MCLGLLGIITVIRDSLMLCNFVYNRVFPNCVMKAKNVRTRIFVADQVEDCKDLSGLYYLLPFQKVDNR